MYKIFINNFYISIVGNNVSDASKQSLVENENLIEEISQLIKNNSVEKNYNIVANRPKKLFKVFTSKFKFIKASGGIVFNKSDQILMIYRLGKWDLPKGKLSKGEKNKKAAIREVEEECGITKPHIIRKLSPTYHIYKSIKGNWFLKKSTWYEMNYTGNEKLIPQTEENIEKCEWMSKKEIENKLNNTYPSLKEMIINAISPLTSR